MRLSFRDPSGYVIRSDGRIFRCVFSEAAADLQSFLSTPFAATETAAGALVRSIPIPEYPTSPDADLWREIPSGSLLFEHPSIPFPNYPYEWAPLMLQEAATLTLRLARGASAAGFGLKDATPYNIMFDGPRPVFLDVLSFARRDPCDPVWRAYAQFVRTFLYPILANRRLGMEIGEMLLSHREGIDPERMRRMCSLGLLIRPPFLTLVTMPALLSRLDGRDASNRSYGRRNARDAHEAAYLLDRVFAQAERVLRRLPPSPKESVGVRYAKSGHNYTEEGALRKEAIVKEALTAARPRQVLDIGCNTGRFSLLAASCGARVVAIDHDESVVDELWRESARQNANVLPLAVNIARPPGAAGWENREHLSFLDRARGHFDCVLMLAVAHHLIVNERAPLEAIFDLLAQLTTRTAIVEYVDRADSQFQRILRGRAELHRDLTPEVFEAVARKRFRVEACREVTPERRIYTLSRAAA